MADCTRILLILGIISTLKQGCYSNLVPIILVPGFGGSRLEARLNKPTVKHHFCYKTTFDFFTIWLDAEELLPLIIDCWIDNMKLNYDDYSNSTFNQPGVTTRVPDFGDPTVVEYLNEKSLQHFVGGYLDHLAAAFVSMGYIRMKNLYAAPYDFRKGPSELSIFFEQLEKLVEEAYDYNNSSIVLMAHSMGGLLALNFLQRKSQQWKDRYIRAFVSLSSPFGGSLKSLKVFANGDDLGIPLLRSEVFKQVLSTMSSIAYMAPVKEIWKNEVVVSTPAKNYTSYDLEDFFNIIGNPTAWKMYLNENIFSSQLSPPNVQVHCFYGEGIGTPKRLIYGSDDLSGQPIIDYEDGDGTVNLRSLQYCKTWLKQQKQRVETKPFYRIDHMGIIKDKWALDYIIRTVKELSSYQ